MKSIGSTLLVVGLCLTSLACSKRFNQAPTSVEELGVIVKGPSLEEMENASIPYRVVNQQVNLYEAKSSLSELRKIFPEAQLEPNKIDHQFIRPLQSLTKKEMAKNAIDSFTSNCSQQGKLRLFVQSTENSEVDVRSQLLIKDIGDTVKLRGFAIGNDRRPVEYLWSFSFIGLGNYESYISSGQNLDLTLNGVGEYKITLLAKSDTNICGDTTFSHLVTSNAPYKNLNFPELFGLDKEPFYHLRQAKIPELIAKRDKKTIVAVIDTGVNYNHALLNSKMALNAGEIPGNGIDDDDNGFVDDYVGYDLYANDPHPMDDDGHGTHVAGLVAGIEIGSGQNVEILAIKAGNALGIDTASMIGAIYYALFRGAKVINLSLGSTNIPSKMELQAYITAREMGVLVVVAAGNGDKKGNGVNLDIGVPVYPASIPLDNILTVGASSLTQTHLAKYSNYGSVVDIVAPGGDLFSPLYSATTINTVKKQLAPSHGTSMAAPLVAGTAGEVLSMNNELLPVEVIDLLIKHGRKDEILTRFVKNPIHLDVEASINAVRSQKLLAQQ